MDLLALTLSLVALCLSLYCLSEQKKKHHSPRRKPKVADMMNPSSKPYAKPSGKMRPKVNDDLAGWKKENDIHG